MRKEEYSGDVLTAKRLMTDFFPATGAVKHKHQESGPSDVAFVETGGDGKWHHMCYCFREKHPGGYRKCSNVNEKVRLQTTKAVKAGHFKKKQDNDSTVSTKATTSTGRRSAPKKGAVFAEVEEEDDDKEE